MLPFQRTDNASRKVEIRVEGPTTKAKGTMNPRTGEMGRGKGVRGQSKISHHGDGASHESEWY